MLCQTPAPTWPAPASGASRRPSPRRPGSHTINIRTIGVSNGSGNTDLVLSGTNTSPNQAELNVVLLNT